MNAPNPTPDLAKTNNHSSIEPVGCRRIAAPMAVLASMIVIATIGFGIYAAFHLRSISANFVARALVRSVNKSAIPEKQRKRVSKKINNVRQRYIDHKLDKNQLKAVTNQVFNDPRINVGLFYYAARDAVKKADIKPAEASQIKTALLKFVHGVDQGKIESQTISDLAPIVSDGGEPKDDVKPAKLHSLADRLEAAVSQANITEPADEVDVADRFNTAVDHALATTKKTAKE